MPQRPHILCVKLYIHCAFLAALMCVFLSPSVYAETRGINTANEQTLLPIGAGGKEILFVVPQEANTSGLNDDAVGIGTENPAAKLEVQGGIKVGVHAADDCKGKTKGTLSFFEKDPTNAAVTVNAMYYCDGTQWKKSGGGGYAITVLGSTCPTGFQVYKTYKNVWKQITGWGGECVHGCGNLSECSPTGYAYTDWTICSVGDFSAYLSICFYSSIIVTSCTTTCENGFSPIGSYDEYLGVSNGGYCPQAVMKRSTVCSR